MELVIPWSRPRAALHSSPGLVVALKVFLGPVWVREITNSRNDSIILFEYSCGGFGSGEIRAVRDVARGQQHNRRLIWFGCTGGLQIVFGPCSSRRYRDEDCKDAQQTNALVHCGKCCRH